VGIEEEGCIYSIHSVGIEEEGGRKGTKEHTAGSAVRAAGGNEGYEENEDEVEVE
jgi:hypothetical protein